MLFTKGIIIASSLAGVGGYVFWKREKQYRSIYNDLSYQTIKQYDFGQVLDHEDLPKGQSFIQLNAITQLEEGNLFQSYFDERDQFLKSGRPFSFTLSNPSGCNITIQNKKHEVLFFNLKKMSQSLSYEEMQQIHGNVKHSVLQKLMAKNAKFIKKGIEEDGEYQFIGNVMNKDGRILMQPRLVIRGETERFLLELDKFLVLNNKRGKICFGMMVGFVALHIVVSKVLFPQYFKKGYRSGPNLFPDNNYQQQYQQQQILESYREKITETKLDSNNNSKQNKNDEQQIQSKPQERDI